MPVKVAKVNECSLNGVFYPLRRPVQSVLASVYPPKTVTGDTTKDDQRYASVMAWSDWRGGIGVDRMKGPMQADRCWFSTCQLRFQGHLVLPALTTTTASFGALTVGAIGELSNEIYIAAGTSVFKYNNTTDSWGTSLYTLPAVATDAITVRMGGTVYLVFAHTGGYSYSSNGTTWTADTTATKYLAFWDDKLWGISNTGQLWWASTIGTETNEAQLALPDGYVTDLFVARNAAGNPILYASTKIGLFAHDDANTKFVDTELALPFHPNGGNGSVRWRDRTFIPVGLGIYAYINGSNSAVITIMGPDRDHGLPSDKRGVIKGLLGTHNELLALVDGTAAPGALNMYDSGGLGSHVTSVAKPDVGFSEILGWDERGWQVLWLGDAGGQAITAAYVSNAYDTYRIWWAHNQRVYYMALQPNIINPSEVSTYTYASSATLETPWFTADQADVDKLALELRAEVQGATATETVKIEYALNYSSTLTTLGTIVASGITIYKFPDSTTPTGTAFRAIRFKITLARGSTTTITPDLVSLTFIFRKKLAVKFGWSLDIDLIREHNGKPPKELRDALLTAIKSATKVEFTFRDDSGGTRNYYVDIVQSSGLEFTGYDERGSANVLVMEP